MSDTVLLEVADGVGRITLNRPEAGNALDLGLARSLLQAVLRCDEDPDVRVVLLRGSGAGFCVGGALAAFAAQGDALPAYVKELTVYLHAAVSRLARGTAPVVAAVHGAAAGAGFSLVCSCDVVIAAESAKLTPAYTRVGVPPDGSMSYFLPRLVGWRTALDLVLRNRVLTAAEAATLGLVTEVVADGALTDAAEQAAAALATGPTSAYAAVKRLFHSSLSGTLETQMELEAQEIAEAMRGHDAREGIAAFLGKRAPTFNGS
jgi:2-(1,2-epoxy-1,2-dihydrophenyl)acetyl-CoA isomerase